jgi:hypothetical protein
MKKQFLVFGALLMTSAGFSQLTVGAGGAAAVGANATTTNTNVGIGTNAPTAKLDVIGNIKASGSVRATGVVTSTSTILGEAGLQTYASLGMRVPTGTVGIGGTATTWNVANNNFKLIFEASTPVAVTPPFQSLTLSTSSVDIGLAARNVNLNVNGSIYATSGVQSTLGISTQDKLSVNNPSKISTTGPSLNPTWSIQNLSAGTLTNPTVSGAHFSGATSGTSMILSDNGQVLIGTTKPTAATYANYKLFVQGGILTDEVRVKLSASGTWADYVFAKDYKLPSIKEVEAFIAKNNHLPNVPSAKQVQEEGINVAQMATIQQEKIEELMLYIIKQDKRIEALEAKLNNK